MAAFSKKEALVFGWNTVRAKWKFFLGFLVLIVLLNYIPGALLNWISDKNILPFVSVAGLSISMWIFQMLISLGQARILLCCVDGTAVGYRQLFGERKLLIGSVVGLLLYAVLAIIGFLLLIIPGVVVMLRLQYWTYCLVDGGLGPVAAVRKSWEITKGSTVNLFLFSLLMLLVGLLGLLALGVGLAVAYPVILIANAWVYRKLTEQVREESNPH